MEINGKDATDMSVKEGYWVACKLLINVFSRPDSFKEFIKTLALDHILRRPELKQELTDEDINNLNKEINSFGLPLTLANGVTIEITISEEDEDEEDDL